MSRRYRFEYAADAALEFIPMSLRYALDVAGVKLSLASWQKMSPAEREALCEMPVESPDARATFAARCFAAADAAGLPAKPLDPAAPLWNDDATCAAVATRALAVGRALTLAQWAALRDDQRYALQRFSAPGKDEAKFAAALAEFCAP